MYRVAVYNQEGTSYETFWHVTEYDLIGTTLVLTDCLMGNGRYGWARVHAYFISLLPGQHVRIDEERREVRA